MLEEAPKKGRSDSLENRYLRRRPDIDSLRELTTFPSNFCLVLPFSFALKFVGSRPQGTVAVTRGTFPLNCCHNTIVAIILPPPRMCVWSSSTSNKP